MTVAYTVNVTGAPAGATYAWWCLPNDGFGVETQTGTSANCTFYQNGTSDASLLVSYPDGLEFWTGYAPTVNITGPSALTLSVTPTYTASPAYVTAWVNTTNASQLPPGYHLWGQVITPCGATMPVYSVSLNRPTLVGPFLFNSSCEVWGSSGYQVDGWLNDGTNETVLGLGQTVWVAPGSGATFDPVIALSITPSNGTAPLNVTFGVAATGGTSPYTLRLGIVGAGPTLANGSRLPAYFFNVSGWNGSSTTPVREFTVVGSWSIVAEVTDAHGNQSWSLGAVETVLPPSAPTLQASAQLAGAGAASSTSISFLGDVTGGTLPYSIQWAFGDGTFGSSIAGGVVTHVFPGPGTYVVRLSVRDAHGALATASVSAVVAASPAGGSPPVGFLPLWAWLAVALLAAAFIFEERMRRRKRRMRAEGARLVGRMAADSAYALREGSFEG